MGLRNLTRTTVCLPSGTVTAPSSAQLTFSHSPLLIHQQVRPALLPKQIPSLPASSCLSSDHSLLSTVLPSDLSHGLHNLSPTKQAEEPFKKCPPDDNILCSKASYNFPSHLGGKLPNTFGGGMGKPSLASYHTPQAIT